MTQVILPYVPREHQREIHRGRKRFSVLVCHRRFGKTVCAINETIKAACVNKLKAPRYTYIAPMYKQAKSIVWDYLKYYTRPIPGISFNEAELRADFPNGGRISLLGADNPDSLRGIYLDGVVLDEMAQMPDRLWGEVIRPTLADREGWAMFIGTPRGHNSFYDLYNFARQDSDWFAHMYKASETRIIPDAELELLKKEMTPEQYEQEFECSFSAAIKGAYYGKLMNQLERDGRITSVPYDVAMPVHTAWDLGISDSTSIWFFQMSPGGEIRIIDYLEDRGLGLPDYIHRLKNMNYHYGTHIAPHDIRVRELGTGKSRLEVAASLGVNFIIAKNIPIMDGINAVRMVLPRCYFDAGKCKDGLEALMQYRSDYNDKGMVFSNAPKHDWASHAADSFRYLALGMDNCTADGFMTEQAAANLYEQYAMPRGSG